MRPCPGMKYKVLDHIPSNTYCQNLQFLRMRPITNKTDFRYNWPAQIFTHICKCSGNYAGYDCSRCKRGYTGSNCEQKSDLIERKNFSSLTYQEQKAVIDAFKTAKNGGYRYTVPIEEEPKNTDSFKLLSLYDIFATFHYYTIRDDKFYDIHSSEPRLSIPDFGHEAPGFLPWHRAYLLYFETEMQYLLNNSSFVLPYWDWTVHEFANDSSGIFQEGLFGSSSSCTDKKMPVDIISDHFGDWDAVCINYKTLTETHQLCNPYVNDLDELQTRTIKRCVGKEDPDDPCSLKYTKPPDARDVEIAINEPVYDACGYDKLYYGTKGFRSILEGSFDFKQTESDFNVSYINESNETGTCDFAGLHNLVHRYIGGLMENVPTASNDPIFWLHHSNVDRLYEKWLTSSNEDTSFKPETLDYRVKYSHNVDEYLGLLFPPMTNAEAHKPAREFGYKYEDESGPSSDGNGNDGNGDNGNGNDGNGDNGNGNNSNGDDGNGDNRNGDDGNGNDGNGNDGNGDNGNGNNSNGDDGNGDNRNGDDGNGDDVNGNNHNGVGGGSNRGSSGAINTNLCEAHIIILPFALYAAMLVW